MPRKELGFFIDRTYKVVRQDLLNRFKENGLDITPEQWVILSRISAEGDMYQTDLAHRSFRDKPTVSRIVDLLAKKGLVKRVQDKTDARRFLITLTPKGKEKVESAYPSVAASREKGWTNLTEEEYTTLVSLLDKVFENYSQEK